jgi:hypothetical protein
MGIHRAMLAGLVAAGACVVVASPQEALAAPGAQVFTVIEGRDTSAATGGRGYLVLIGQKLTTIRTIELRDSADADAGPMGAPLLKSPTMFVLALPEGLPAGQYELVLTPARGTALRVKANVTYGAPPAGTIDDTKLTASLKQKVDDGNATALGGLPPSAYRNASNLSTGTLSTDLYSAVADLIAEGKLGVAADQLAKGDHEHDARYPLKTELSSAGQVNLPTNPIDWTRLKNVPTNFVTGAGEGLVLASGALALDWAGFAGELGTSAKPARSDHVHDARYFTQTQLSGVGTLNTATNPLEWTKLKSVPAGFADDVDDVGTAGAGLRFASGVFSADFAGTGSLNTVARSDHEHDARYFTQSQLAAVGSINLGTNPVDWTKLKGVPSGFADNVDDVGAAGSGLSLAGSTLSVVWGGTGSATTAARSDHNHDSIYAAVAHNHDTIYFTQAQLSVGGAINTSGNPVDWTKLKGVPFGFADGNDDFGPTYLAGNGVSLANSTFSVNFGGDGSSNQAARADHTHANSFVSKSGDTMTGALSTWSGSDSIPAINGTCVHGNGIGVKGVISNQGVGIGVLGTSVEGIGVKGTSNNYGVWARGNTGVYTDTVNDSGVPIVANQASTNGGDIARFQRNGTTLMTIGSSGNVTTSGALTVASVTASAVSASLNSSSTQAISGTNGASGGVAVRGAGVFSGVNGVALGSGGYGVYGESTGANSSSAVYGAKGSGSGFGVWGNAYHYESSAGVLAGCSGSADGVPALVANHSSTNGGDLARFQRNGSNVARIDVNGKGYFNGGTQASGADFAESVAVKGDSSKFEPGDVIVVDPDSDRRFALSAEAESTLVAGVYSTKPALLGTTHDVAADDGNLQEEIPLGIVGICPTKVCDEGGAIKRGDLLVTASIKGYAKKAPKDVKPGTILGKALGVLAKGRGKIEVLISLQ